jgi:glycosyltransferase involved in cell wall biosynthesis
VNGLKNEVKVTIGLCVKDCESTVSEAVNSIINQDFPHEKMELIVVEGYSEDKTLSTIKELLLKVDFKVKFFFENKGLGFARQTVVENASGTYIVWVDGDMILTKDFIRRQVNFMEKNPKVGVGKGKYGILNEKSLVAILENLKFVLDYSREGETSGPMGTSGCIYRLAAIKQVGGFSSEIKGVGEDMDAEQRVRAAGWSVCITPAVFYEKRRNTWKALWNEYFWHGFGFHYLYHGNKASMTKVFQKMFPPILFLSEFLGSIKVYQLTKKKISFLMPLHYLFKRAAWFYGFVKSHLRGYGHKTNFVT